MNYSHKDIDVGAEHIHFFLRQWTNGYTRSSQEQKGLCLILMMNGTGKIMYSEGRGKQLESSPWKMMINA